MSRVAPETVSIRTAASELGVHENTVRNYLNKNLLGYIARPSGYRRVLKEDVARMKADMAVVPAVDPGEPTPGVPWEEDPEGTADVHLP